MGYVAKRRQRADPGIGRFTHRVILCTAKDIVDLDQQQLRLKRVASDPVWAMIEPKRAQMFSADGRAIQEGREQQSHLITIRAIPGVDLTHAAWVYEDRGDLMAPRWFKFLSEREMGETGNRETFWQLSCRLVERSELAAKPAASATCEPSPSMATPLPAGVKL